MLTTKHGIKNKVYQCNKILIAKLIDFETESIFEGLKLNFETFC